MMDAYNRFELVLNDQIVRTPIAIASMAGIVDADYVLARADHIGAAFIGGYALDSGAIRAAHELVEAGRSEFLPDDPVSEIARQVERLRGSGVVAGVNIRATDPASYSSLADDLGDGIIYEIDAHCRQQPMVDAGCGEYLLTHPERLEEHIRALKSEDVTVSVKIRAGIADNDRNLARRIWKAGADIIHVDLMDTGSARVRQIRNSCPLFIIANNGINSYERMTDMFSHGADMVSLARCSDVRTLAGMDAAIRRYAEETGWYNAPKHLCRGGDVRALTFCCMPVKNCPLQNMLKKVGLTPREFVDLKLEAVAGTPLEGGRNTCFGSLAWCCKLSSPCMFRHMALQEVGLSGQEYMRYKHRLSDTIMKRIFNEGTEVSED
ncbi:MAG: methanogenesis marker 9 domain-containing protein [Methanoculleaceae archaeon]